MSHRGRSNARQIGGADDATLPWKRRTFIARSANRPDGHVACRFSMSIRSRGTIGTALTVVACLAALPPAVQAQHDDPTATGERLYRTACAACHGSDGRGAARELVRFETPLPDFSDCSFATREPDADWGAIIHAGGPARAFDRLMPAFGSVLSAEEIERVLAYVRGFCADRAWPRGELNLPRPLFTEKAYPEDEAVVTTSAAVEGAGAWEGKLIYERRFGARNQVEIVLPFGVHERAPGDWTGGLGDIAIGAKRALYHSLTSGTILSVAGEVILPTGDEDDGLGNGGTILEPFLAFGQFLPAEWFLQLQGGFEIQTRSGRDHEAFWRGAVGRSFSEHGFGRTWTPMLELLGARELAGGVATEWDLVPQLQVTLSTRQHIMANIGIRVPLDDPHRPTTAAVYLLWDWFDGGFLEGW
jgi:mono/diheme cytochrome c family protein